MNATKSYRITLFLSILLSTGPVSLGLAQSQPASSGWKHFGVSDSPPDAATSDSGWRHFGDVDVAARVRPGNRPTRPQVTASRIGTGSVTALEHQMYELINRDRLDSANGSEAGKGAQPLRWNSKLAAVARAHSEEMLQSNFFDHVDPEGRSPALRVKAAGIDWQSVGENIAVYENVTAAQTAFMNEPRFGHNHRSNILSSKYTEVGVGIVKAPDGRYYITQDFIKPAGSLQQASAGH